MVEKLVFTGFDPVATKSKVISYTGGGLLATPLVQVVATPFDYKPHKGAFGSPLTCTCGTGAGRAAELLATTHCRYGLKSATRCGFIRNYTVLI